MNQPGVKEAHVRRSDGHARLSQLDGLRALAILMVVSDSMWPVFPKDGRESRFSCPLWISDYRNPGSFPECASFLGSVLHQARDPNFASADDLLRDHDRDRGDQLEDNRCGLSVVLFLANFIQAMPSTPMGAVGVTWSLAVEEHFYFLWPVAVRFLPRKTLIAIATGTVLLSPLARALVTPHLSTWRPIYYWTPFGVCRHGELWPVPVSFCQLCLQSRC